MWQSLMIVGLSLGFFSACGAERGRNAEDVQDRSALTANAATPLSYSELKADIQRYRLGSMEDLLDFFQRTPRYHELLRAPVLEKRSGGIHRDEVTPEYPRVVLSDGNLVMHFIGHGGSPSSQLLEIAEYQPVDHRFMFRLVNFKLAGRDLMFLDDAAASLEDQDTLRLYEQTVGKGVFSCGGCHEDTGDGGRLPIWSPRPVQYRPYRDFIAMNSEEGQGFAKFLRTLAEPVAGRLYRKLGLRWEVDARAAAYRLESQGTKKLSEQLFAHARDRVGSKILSARDYHRLQYAIVGVFFTCHDIETFFPDEIRTTHESAIIAKLNSTAIGHNFLPLDVLIKAEDIQPRFRATYRQQASLHQGGLDYLDEPRFLAMTSRPLAEALGFAIKWRNQMIQKRGERDLDAAAVALDRKLAAPFIATDYIAALAKLRYLLQPGTTEPFDLPINLMTELPATGDEPMTSFRYDGFVTGIEDVVSDVIGPKFVADNPELNVFNGKAVAPINLTVPLEAYCEKLRAKSLTTLAAPGLESTPGPLSQRLGS